MRFSPVIWIVRSAMCAMMPPTAHLPGVRETGLDAFLWRLRRECDPVMWLGVIAGSVLFALTPILTLGIPLPAFLLPRRLLDVHAHRIATSRLYHLRQIVFLVKMAAGWCWAAHPDVRAAFALPPYPEDPGTFRTGRSDIVRRVHPPRDDATGAPTIEVMTHLAFQPRGADLCLETDWVVVGSGAGGASAAVVLARGGAKVVIVEAGPWRDPADYPSSVYGVMRDLFDAWGSTVARGRALWPIVQGSAVGGSTVINSAICVRTPGDIFDRWLREQGVGGDALAERVWRHQDVLEEELSVAPVPDSAAGRLNTLAMAGSRAVGYEAHVMRRYVKGCLGAGQCLQGCRNERKQSTNLNFVPEVLARGGDVLSCAPVDRVLIERGRAVGVRGRFRHPVRRTRGSGFVVRARRGVVVAASATHGPALLQRSGVRNRTLGRHFRAHPGTGIFGVYDDPVDMNLGATQGWASVAFREEPGFKLESLSIPPSSSRAGCRAEASSSWSACGTCGTWPCGCKRCAPNRRARCTTASATGRSSATGSTRPTWSVFARGSGSWPRPTSRPGRARCCRASTGCPTSSAPTR